MAKAEGWALAKMEPPGSNSIGYPHHDRANSIYSQWMSGYTEDEIAEAHGLTVEEVKRDLMYANTRLTTRQVIAHNNDRTRILVQRETSERYRKLLQGGLGTPIDGFLSAGINPSGILREFREATGLVQKAEPLLQINTQNIIGGTEGRGSGITSAEDVIRRVLDRISKDAVEPVTEVQAEAEQQDTPEEDQIPEDED